MACGLMVGISDGAGKSGGVVRAGWPAAALSGRLGAVDAR